MMSPKEYFRNKSAEQIFSLCLLVACVALMLFCAIVRLCGGLWFSADLSKVEVPSEFWQAFIKGVLLLLELAFVYKILCRAKWAICILVGIIQVIAITYIPNLSNTAINIINLVLYFIVPLCFTRQWQTLIDSAVLYGLTSLYAATFLIGRIGEISVNSGYDFAISIFTTIDYKLFIISIYLIQYYFGGIRIWKSQKRLILQKDLKQKKE